jgi:hypothetical protein
MRYLSGPQVREIKAMSDNLEIFFIFQGYRSRDILEILYSTTTVVYKAMRYQLKI